MYTLKLKSAEKNCFKFYNSLISQDIPYTLFSIKKKKNFYSVIRSPHANKNSQEQFNLIYFKHILKIKNPKLDTKDSFYSLKHSLLQDQNISGSIYETKKINFFSFF
jgi:ribosomal protein S10